MRRDATVHLGALAAAILSSLLLAARPAGVAAAGRETFAVDFVVTIRRSDPGTVHVRWELTGGEEVRYFSFEAPPDRFGDFAASGELTLEGGRATWKPGGPYGHLSYRVKIDHRRGDHGRFDSYAGNDWAIVRARDLFPKIRFDNEPGKDGQEPRSRSRLVFRLPSGWRSVAAHPALSAGVFRIESPYILSRPSGWLALGNVDVARQEIDGVMVRIARAPGSNLPVDPIYALLSDALPRLRRIFRVMPPEILIVSAGDPMFRGGLSAHQSLFLHGDRPLRTPDKTSPVLHELFHVVQPFQGAKDADWLVEGLAEYYSLELQRRAGSLSAAGFTKGLRSFSRHGLWGADLTRQTDNAATNNSAPLVLWALDQRIQRATAGKKRLDDVVSLLEGEVTTADFRAAVAKVSGKKMSRFFQEYVIEGKKPLLDSSK